MTPNKGNTRPIIAQGLGQAAKTKKTNVVVNYLLLNMAKMMLATLVPDDEFTKAVQKAADTTKRRMLASHTEEELAPIKLMNETAIGMARKLAHCDDVATLEASLHYMQDLLKGDVLIVKSIENPDPNAFDTNV